MRYTEENKKIYKETSTGLELDRCKQYNIKEMNNGPEYGNKQNVVLKATDYGPPCRNILYMIFVFSLA